VGCTPRLFRGSLAALRSWANKKPRRLTLRGSFSAVKKSPCQVNSSLAGNSANPSRGEACARRCQHRSAWRVPCFLDLSKIKTRIVFARKVRPRLRKGPGLARRSSGREWTPESALPDASPRSLLLNQMNEGQQEAQKHQQSDSPNEQSGTEIMITNRSRQGVSLPETVVRCVEFAIRPGISGSQCRRPRVLQPCGPAFC